MLPDVMRSDTVGRRLAPYVEGKKLSHVEQQAGVSGGYLTRLLKDEWKHPDEERVRKICKAVSADFEWVYHGRGAAPPAVGGSRWAVYGASRAGFHTEATIARAAGIEDAVLDAATVLLGDQVPTREAAKAAIVEAARGVAAYRSLVPGFANSSTVGWDESPSVKKRTPT